METRAHHVLIGAFTVLVVAAALLFALWLTASRVDQEFSYYDVVFTEAVTGLSQGGAVQYNGIKVGDVTRLRLDPADPRKVIARIRVRGDTPVKRDTHAKLALQGLTGVAFIQLSGGSPGSPALVARRGDHVPVIRADPSALQKLLAGGEDIVTNVNEIIARATRLFSTRNVEHINHALENLDKTTATLADQRQNIDQLLGDLAHASRQLDTTLGKANGLIAHADGLLSHQGEAVARSAQQTLQSTQRLSENLDRLIDANSHALAAGSRGFAQLGPTLSQLRDTLRALNHLTARLNQNPAGYLLGRDQPKEFQPQ